MGQALLLQGKEPLVALEIALRLLERESREGAPGDLRLLTRNQSIEELRALARFATAPEFAIEGVMSAGENWGAELASLFDPAYRGIFAQAGYEWGSVRLALQFTVAAKWLLTVTLLRWEQSPKGTGADLPLEHVFRRALAEVGVEPSGSNSGRLPGEGDWELVPGQSANLETSAREGSMAARVAASLARQLDPPSESRIQVIGTLAAIEEMHANGTIIPAPVPPQEGFLRYGFIGGGPGGNARVDATRDLGRELSAARTQCTMLFSDFTWSSKDQGRQDDTLLWTIEGSAATVTASWLDPLGSDRVRELKRTAEALLQQMI